MTTTEARRVGWAASRNGTDVSSLARLTAAVDDVATVLARESALRTRPRTSDEEARLRYAEGYFSALCFALGVLSDRPPAAVAADALGRVG